ncbi:hypothetical protein BASA81_004092 [Batrachochytrium salamandrivorans]|nr:hypothetical protein BASA81_004092 [Batrachochytrium salamandrivorans]
MFDEEPIVLDLALPRRGLGLPLAMVRTRDRRHKRHKRTKTPETFTMKIRGEYQAKHFEMQSMGLTRMKELIQVAIGDLLGETGAEAFTWQVLRFESGVAELRVCTAHLREFRAALALLVTEDGARLRILV